jgi:hypothetical protein
MPTTPQTALRLSPHARELADQYGRGNMTTGITHALAALADLVEDQLPLPLTKAQLVCILGLCPISLATTHLTPQTLTRQLARTCPDTHTPAAWRALRKAVRALTPPQLLALAAANDTYHSLLTLDFDADTPLFAATFHLS